MSCRAVVAENLRHLRRRTGRPGRSPVKASICSERQRSVESLSSLLSESLSLPESLESPSSPLSAESASSPVSPSLTVAPPCARTPGQTVLISSSSRWTVSTPMTGPPVPVDVRPPRRTTQEQAQHPRTGRTGRHHALLPPTRPTRPCSSTAAGHCLWIVRRSPPVGAELCKGAFVSACWREVALEEWERDLDQLPDEGVGAGVGDRQLAGREQVGHGLGPGLGDNGIVRAAHHQGRGDNARELVLDAVAQGEPVGGQHPAEPGVAVVAQPAPGLARQ